MRKVELRPLISFLVIQAANREALLSHHVENGIHFLANQGEVRCTNRLSWTTVRIERLKLNFVLDTRFRL